MQFDHPSPSPATRGKVMRKRPAYAGEKLTSPPPHLIFLLRSRVLNKQLIRLTREKERDLNRISCLCDLDAHLDLVRRMRRCAEEDIQNEI